MNLREPMITRHPAIITDRRPEIESKARVVQSTDRSCRPLDQVDLDPPTDRSRALRPVDDEPDPDGCSPWACRSGEAIGAPTAEPTDSRRQAA